MNQIHDCQNPNISNKNFVLSRLYLWKCINIIYVSKISGKWSILSQEGEIEVKVAHLYVQPSTVLIFFLDLLPTENLLSVQHSPPELDI